MADAQDEVLEAEARVEAANEAGDIGALTSIMANDFSFVGGNGTTQDRDGWISNVLGRRQTPAGKEQAAATVERAASLSRGTVLLLTGLRVGESDEHEVEVHGDVALANRRYFIHDPDGSERCLRYVRLYRRTDAGWRLVSHRYIHAVD
jgi:ketosteroid isomerase-like protein